MSEHQPDETAVASVGAKSPPGTHKKTARKKKAKVAKRNFGKRPFPADSLEDALAIALKIKELNGGNPWSPTEVANALGKSAKTMAFYYLTASSRDYGLTEGTRGSDKISLATIGHSYVYAGGPDEEKAQLQAAFFNVPIFKKVYAHYKGSTLPELKYLGNTLKSEFGLREELHAEFHRLFQENCRFIQKLGDFAPTNSQFGVQPKNDKPNNQVVTIAAPSAGTAKRIFVAMPFSEKSGKWPKGFFSEVLSNLITPAGVNAGFKVDTARKEGSDVIQATIVNDLLKADLVVADLTDHNPNVLFELGMRMAHDKPVALIRAEGTGPIFDVDSMLRVFEYSPNLWQSTLETDVPKLKAHIEGAWDNRATGKTYLQLLKEQ